MGDRVVVSPFALADYEGSANFTTTSDVQNHLTSGDEDMPEGITRVDVKMLDSVFEQYARRDEKIALLKIDAEGSDLAVLHGATATLTVHRPAILTEVFGGGDETRLWLEQQGYAVYQYDPTTRSLILVPLSFAGQGTFIAIHDSRLRQTEALLSAAQRPVLSRPIARWFH